MAVRIFIEGIRAVANDRRDTFKFVVLGTGGPQKGCGMAFIKKPFRRLAEGGASDADTYIDLAELSFENEGGSLGEPAEHLVKVAEIYRYEDVADLTTHVYNGNILLIDYTSLASDDLALKRITAEMKSAVRDCGGDVAVVGKNILMATPSGIKIDRAKIKGAF
jgi:uncharacterized protein